MLIPSIIDLKLSVTNYENSGFNLSNESPVLGRGGRGGGINRSNYNSYTNNQTSVKRWEQTVVISVPITF